MEKIFGLTFSNKEGIGFMFTNNFGKISIYVYGYEVFLSDAQKKELIDFLGITDFSKLKENQTYGRITN